MIVSREETERRMCANRNNVTVMLIAIIGVVAVLGMAVTNVMDNDLWFILSTGRDIVESGIPYVNTWGIHDGLSTIIQQWVPDVLAWLAYDNIGGILGIGALLAVSASILAFVMYRTGKLFSGRSYGGEGIVLLMIPSLIAMSSYLSARPHVYTMLFIFLVVYVCEAYRRGGGKSILVLLPLLMFAHVNFHMSMAPFDLFIVACYLIPDIPSWYRRRIKPGIERFLGQRLRDSRRDGIERRDDGHVELYRAGYDRKPLFFAFAGMCLAMLVNPYGIDGALYLVKSYSAADYADYISEMGALTPWNAEWSIFMVVMLVIGAMAIGKRTSRSIDLPLSLMFVVTAVLSFQHVRNVWLVVPFAFLLACDAFGGIHVPRMSPVLGDLKLTRVAFGVVLACVCALFAGTAVNHLMRTDIDSDGRSTPSAAMDYLDAVGADKETTRIFNFFNAGGYIEYRGYKVFIDARPELWEPGITGDDRHYYREFVDAANGSTDIMELVDEYEFDYLIANTNTTLNSALSGDDRYHIAMSGNGYNLYERNDIRTSSSTTTFVEGSSLS